MKIKKIIITLIIYCKYKVTLLPKSHIIKAYGDKVTSFITASSTAILNVIVEIKIPDVPVMTHNLALFL
jgi:hypothetical protein